MICDSPAWVHVSGKCFLFDSADTETLAQWVLVLARGYLCGALRGPEWRKHIRVHRALLNAPRGMLVDHINGNIADNRRCNLRLCTHSQSVSNRHTVAGSKSRYKGVGFHNGRWLAKIRDAGRQRHLGYFANETDAACAYDAAARSVFGDFARFNFPHDGEQSAIKGQADAR